MTWDGSCAIALGDPGRVFTVDAAGSSPCTSLGSGADRMRVDLRDQRCDGSVGAATWRQVRLSDTDASEMESLVVTVRDGRTDQVLKSGDLIAGDGTLDLTGIDAQRPPGPDRRRQRQEQVGQARRGTTASRRGSRCAGTPTRSRRA